MKASRYAAVRCMSSRWLVGMQPMSVQLMCMWLRSMQPMELLFSVGWQVCGQLVHIQQAAGGYAADGCAADRYVADGIVV